MCSKRSSIEFYLGGCREAPTTMLPVSGTSLSSVSWVKGLSPSGTKHLTVYTPCWCRHLLHLPLKKNTCWGLSMFSSLWPSHPSIHLGYVWPFVHTMPTGAHIREINYSRRLNRAIRVNYWPGNVHHMLAIFTFVPQSIVQAVSFPSWAGDWIDAYESVNNTYTVFL